MVALGASAGGVEALKILLQNLPPDLPAAFLVVTHTSVHGKSHMPDVLGHFTRMEIVELKRAARPRPGVVYTVSAGQGLVVGRGLLKPAKPLPEGPPHAIARLLESMARALGPRAVAVILSGTGNDGARGLEMVARSGGLALVQEPSTAQQRGMPESAIATGRADLVLDPEGLAAALERTLRSPLLAAEPPVGQQTLVDRILALLREHQGHDLTGYKSSTIVRRLHKRMLLAGESDLGAYVRTLEHNPGERSRLFKDLLIGVTSFYRDPEFFAVLRDKAVPALVRDRDRLHPLRVWVAGCSTGEEAYSVAMLLDDALASRKPRLEFKVYATDIDKDAVEVARKGLYAQRQAASLPADLAQRYFRRSGNKLAVLPRLRETIVFATHDMLQDPPFLHMDLVLCRNVLIYMTPAVQERVFSILAYSLNPGGYLALGPAEAMANHSARFEAVDKKWRVFKRKAQKRGPMEFPARLALHPLPASSAFRPPAPAVTATPALAAERALLRRYAPPAALVDPDLRVLHLSGDTNPFLELPEGELNLNLLRLVKKPLRPALRALLESVCAQRQSKAAKVRYPSKGSGQVHIVVDPQMDPEGMLQSLLVCFEQARAEDGLPDASPQSYSDDSLIWRYEAELQLANEQLQQAVEGYESLNEELKASNEELLSMNEELQSSNEEMEASREELQSLNEELTNLNAELSAMVDELAQEKAFVENLLASTKLAAVFLDRDMRILRFTPEAGDLFYLVPADQGRPLSEVKAKVDDADILGEARAVLAGPPAPPREIQAPDGRWYLKRAFPYHSPQGAVEGAVLTYTDVTLLKDAEEVLRNANVRLESLVAERTRELLASTEEAERRAAELEAVMEQVPAAVWIARDPEGKVIEGNRASYSLLELPQGSNLSRRPSEGHAPPPYRNFSQGREMALEELPMQRAARGERVDAMELDIVLPDGRTRTILGNATPLRDKRGKVVGALGSFLDITARKQAERDIRNLARFPGENPNPVLRVGRDCVVTYANVASRDFLAHCGGMVGKPLPGPYVQFVSQAFATGQAPRFEARVGEKTFAMAMSVVPDEGYVNIYGMDISERKRLEESQERHLKESRTQREFLEKLIRTAPIAIGVVEGPEHRYVLANPAYELAPHDRSTPMAGRTLADVFPSVAAEVGKMFDAIYETGQATHLHEFVVPIGSRTTWWDADYVPLFDESGKVAQILILGHEVTGRIEALAAMRRSEERFRTLFENHQAPFFLINPDTGAIVDANASAAASYGYTQDELRSMLIWDINRLPREEVLAAKRQAASGARSHFVFPHVLKSGEVRTVEVYSTPVDVEGRPLLFSIVHDITDRALAEAQLRESEERFRTLVESAPEAIFVQTGGRFSYLNQAAVDLFGGRTREDLLGTPVLDRIHPDYREIARERIRQLNEDRTSQSRRGLVFLKLDGTEVHAETLGTPIAYQEARGALVFIHDMSERLRFERDITRAKEAAEAANKAKGEFLANMSHELRTPLNGVLGMLQLLDHAKGRDAEQDVLLDTALESGRGLLTIVNDILSFVQLEAGKISIERQPLKLRDLVQSVLRAFRYVAADKGLDLQAEVDPGVPDMLMLDPGRVRQVLFNLVGNSMKFTEQGAISINVCLLEHRPAAGEGVLLCTVADTGIGIPDDKLTLIFEPFTQADSSLRRKYHGTGIGLGIVRQMVQLMGGSVCVESRLGQGTAMRFTLRCGLELPARSRRPRRSNGRELSVAGLKVLLAEDDRVNRFATTRFLERLGCTVSAAENGRQAVEMARAAHYDCIIMDIQMPEMDGMEATRAIRNTPDPGGKAKVPILAMTAHALPGDREKFLAAGMDGYIAKPVELDELLAALAAVLDQD